MRWRTTLRNWQLQWQWVGVGQIRSAAQQDPGTTTLQVYSRMTVVDVTAPTQTANLSTA